MRRSVLVLGLLAGCAGTGGTAVPQAVRLTGETLTLSLSDGTVCRAPWKAEGGAGRLEGCGAGYDYRVTEATTPNPLRQFFVGLTDALGLGAAVPPMADVVVSGAGRDWRFASPPSAD